VLRPFGAEVELLDTIPGVDRRVAECLIAEIGVDMARFGSSARLASMGGLCPGQNEAAGKQKSGQTRKGSKWLGANLTEPAETAGHAKNIYLSAQFQRLGHGAATRRHAKPLPTQSLSLPTTSLDQGVPYSDLGPE